MDCPNIANGQTTAGGVGGRKRGSGFVWVAIPIVHYISLRILLLFDCPGGKGKEQLMQKSREKS